MTFETEPEWMKNARQAPLRSTYDSRHPNERRIMQRSPNTDRRTPPTPAQ